jgi:hypothetical protein
LSIEPAPLHVRVAVRVGEILDGMSLRHMVCGSIASSIHGEPRSTNDIDFVVEFGESDVERLATALSAEFFVDARALLDAARSGASCNAIHRATGIKIDLFRLRDREFSRAELSRSARKSAAPDRTLTVASAEDTILTKLEWYRKGGEVSDRQWRDICGLLKQQSGKLDEAYLVKWGQALGVTDLLQRARRDAHA